MHPRTRKTLYFEMLRIRRVEETIAETYPKDEIRCPIHLSIGQEATAVGVCQVLRQTDLVFGSHRCHGLYLAKGGDLRGMFAELFGKRSGCASGKGGSMHLVDPPHGMMGASALVGGSIPLAVGAALAIGTDRQERVAAAFFGDGATEEGVLWESLNFAALKSLPVLFVCENNLYATYSHQRNRQAFQDIASKARSFVTPVFEADGNDVEVVYHHASIAAARARAGGGPTFLELKTYRWRDHVGPGEDAALGYRTAQEIEAWKAQCPVERLETKLLEHAQITTDEIKEREELIRQEIESALEHARLSPVPAASAVKDDVYG